MSRPIYCKFNMDTACVDVIFLDGAMISIYCPGVADEVAGNLHQRTELEWLMYNAPAEYAELILHGDPGAYLKTSAMYNPMD